MFTIDTNIQQIIKYVVSYTLKKNFGIKREKKHLFGDNLQQLRCRKSSENCRNINPVVDI